MDEMQKIHRKFGVDLFNEVWRYLDKPERTAEENDTMLHAAHASRYHWGQVGEPVNFARGEWQVSRVYSVLGRSEPAFYHAQRSLEICLANQIGDFDLAFAYEALARAAAVGGDLENARKYYAQAKQASEAIQEAEDKALLLSDLQSVPLG